MQPSHGHLMVEWEPHVRTNSDCYRICHDLSENRVGGMGGGIKQTKGQDLPIVGVQILLLQMSSACSLV